MRVCFYTLGCKVNLNETEALEQLFKRSGFTVVPDGVDADVYIVNSCTVTNFGAQKSRKWLRQAKRKNPGAVTVMSGCWPQASPEAAAGMTEADVVCGTTNRRAILGYVQQMLAGHERIVAIQPHERGEAFEELPVDRFETHTRAFIKVEDGCNRRCAYCVIPRARGPVRSRAEESILAELRQLAAAGYREAVLSAISLPSYGSDTGTDLYELIERCAAVEGIERIRLGSLDPDMLTPEGIRRMAAVDKLCPQFHLSLQSGCDATLRRMRRPYTTAQYLQVVQQLREAYGGDHHDPAHVTTLDVAKRLLDYGFHAPTIYFPLLFHEAMMIEPTETESRETLDAFIEVMKTIAEEARTNPELVKGAPHHTPVRRLDDVKAVKEPRFTFNDYQ